MKEFIFVVLCFVSTFSYAQEQVVPYPVENPKQTLQPEIPEDLKGLVWNKWSTKNFIIISIDKNQGLFLKNNIEKFKSQLFDSWGIKDVDFKGECKVVCVSNKKLLKRIFRLDDSKFEVRKSENGDISCVIWFSLEEKNNDFPIFELMQVCSTQLEAELNDSVPLFCKRGMGLLSENFESIRTRLLENNLDKISFNDISSKKEQDLKNQKEMNDFDVSSAVVCLLLRKEYGQDNFLNYLHTKNIGEFGINNIEKLNEIINRYYGHLMEDLKNNKTPKDYLQVKNSRR